jgi:amino acid permease
MLFHTGGRLGEAGPASLFLGYLIVATLLYAVLVKHSTMAFDLQITTGEMTSLLPIRGALFMLPYRFLNRQAVRLLSVIADF